MLLNRLSSGYLINEQAALDAIKRNGLFQALDEASMVKIDFHVGEKIPGELGRSIAPRDFPGGGGPSGLQGGRHPVQAPLDPAGEPQGEARCEGDAERRRGPGPRAPAGPGRDPGSSRHSWRRSNKRLDDRRPSRMRAVQSGFAAIIAASGVFCSSFLPGSRRRAGQADRVGLGSQPGRSRSRPFRARRGVQRRTATHRLPDARHGQGPLPGHHQEARGSSLHRPGRRAAPFLLLFRIRAIVPPGGQDRSRLRHRLLGHGDVQRQQSQAGQGISQGGTQAGRPDHPSRVALSGRARVVPARGCRRPSPAPGLAPGARDDRPGVPRRHRRPRLAGDGDLAEFDDGSGIGSRQAVDTVLDTVLQVEPMHPGAHHYRIHLWDGSKPIRAEKSAALYAKTAPGSLTPGTCRGTPTPSSSGMPTPPTSRKARPASTTPT